MTDLNSSNDISPDHRRWQNRSPLSIILSIALAILLIACIGATVYLIKIDKGESFTEFYILGPDGKADNYPGIMEPGDDGQVIMGIVNHEYEDVNYWVEIRLNEEMVEEIGPLLLTQDEKWEQIVTFTPTTIGKKQKVEFILYKENKDNQYLILNLWIDVEET